MRVYNYVIQRTYPIASELDSLIKHELTNTDWKPHMSQDLRAMKYLDLESAVSCTRKTQTILRKDSTKWIFLEGQATQGTRILTPTQLLGYLNDSEYLTSSILTEPNSQFYHNTVHTFI